MPIKILEKRERGRIQGLPKIFGYPLLSQERVKLRTSNFVGTFTGLIGTKSHENVGNSAVRVVSESRKFSGQGTHGALRGHLCDSTAFLFPVMCAGSYIPTHRRRNRGATGALA